MVIAKHGLVNDAMAKDGWKGPVMSLHADVVGCMALRTTTRTCVSTSIAVWWVFPSVWLHNRGGFAHGSDVQFIPSRRNTRVGVVSRMVVRIFSPCLWSQEPNEPSV